MNSILSTCPIYDVAIVGGGPAGATAAHELARSGHRVLLLDKDGRIKPCGGAVPPRLVRDFEIPEKLLKARARSARIISPSDRSVDMPIDGGYVGMVDRGEFDEWLRRRAADAGADRRVGECKSIDLDDEGYAKLHYEYRSHAVRKRGTIKARYVIAADGANSRIARQALPEGDDPPFVFASHDIVRSPADGAFDGSRCDVYYQGRLSPDFYGWIFPHGEETSVGTGTAVKGFSIRRAISDLRDAAGLGSAELVRREGAPLPLRPRKRWDDGRRVLVIGDAAGVVAPASGEGIYYAMLSGQLGAAATAEAVASGDARKLALARKRFMKEHGRVFWVLGMMQKFWYSSDSRRERFVTMCGDPDVQHLTWEAYMNKRLVRARPAAHFRIFVKDMAHLLGLAPTA